ALLRIGLVVERNDLDLLALDAALGVQFVGEELEGLEPDFADAGAAARQRIDITDLDCLLRHRRSAGHEQREGRRRHEFTHVFARLIGVSWYWLRPGRSDGLDVSHSA